MADATETNDRDFAQDVIQASHNLPILVDFWAPWCGPCRLIGPLLEKLAAITDRWRLVKVNTDACMGLAQRYQIQSIPALKLFVDGKVKAELVGALPESEIKRWLDQQIPSAGDQRLEAAQKARQAGQNAEAEKILEEVLQNEPDHPGAKVELAEMLLWRDNPRAIELVSGLDMHPEVGDRASGIATLVTLVDAEAPDGDSEVAKQYRDAIAALETGDFNQAAAAFIAVVQRDRKLDDDGARRALVALFRWLGDSHPITRQYRPRLTSALF